MEDIVDGNKDVAFYYPGHLWDDPDWIKSLLLFFDGVGLLVPEYKEHEIELRNPELAQPLRDLGLLHYLVADKVIDGVTTRRLAEAIEELVEGANFAADLRNDVEFHSISNSRLGSFGDEKTYRRLTKMLVKKGLARESSDGYSTPVHPMVRYFALTILPQILRANSPLTGISLLPTTDRIDIVHSLNEVLGRSNIATPGEVVAFDLETVAVDMSKVPLDDVLSFRTEYSAGYRRYMRSVRQFAREVSLAPEGERQRMFHDRQAELKDVASDLRRQSRSVWRIGAGFGFGLAGAFWTCAGHDPIAALLTTGALIGQTGSLSNQAGAYSYLFDARRAL